MPRLYRSRPEKSVENFNRWQGCAQKRIRSSWGMMPQPEVSRTEPRVGGGVREKGGHARIAEQGGSMKHKSWNTVGWTPFKPIEAPSEQLPNNRAWAEAGVARWFANSI